MMKRILALILLALIVAACSTGQTYHYGTNIFLAPRAIIADGAGLTNLPLTGIVTNGGSGINNVFTNTTLKVPMLYGDEEFMTLGPYLETDEQNVYAQHYQWRMDKIYGAPLLIGLDQSSTTIVEGALVANSGVISGDGAGLTNLDLSTSQSPGIANRFLYVSDDGTLVESVVNNSDHPNAFLGLSGPGEWAPGLYYNGVALTNLNASQLTSGTVPLARLPYIPQLGSANLTNWSALAITTRQPAHDALTNLTTLASNRYVGTFTGTLWSSPTNTPTDGYVVTATGTSGASRWGAPLAGDSLWTDNTQVFYPSTATLRAAFGNLYGPVYYPQAVLTVARSSELTYGHSGSIAIGGGVETDDPEMWLSILNGQAHIGVMKTGVLGDYTALNALPLHINTNSTTVVKDLNATGTVSANNGLVSLANNKGSLYPVTPTGSPFSFTNTFGTNVITVFVGGGTVSAIGINDTDLGVGNNMPGMSLPGIQPGEWVTVTYSVAPTIKWKVW